MRPSKIKMKISIFNILSAVLLLFIASIVRGSLFDCSESRCGVRVSKCMLIKSCNCSMTPEDLKSQNCTCCKDCVKCLGNFFTDCCSCVGLCRPRNEIDPSLKMRSFVDELMPAEDQRKLFELLTTDPSSENDWTVESFPALQNGFFYKANQDETKDRALESWKDVNCTVAFIDHCLSLEKCRRACESMGGSSYRWFHTGCCECIGEDCLNYGLREGKCAKCQELEELETNQISGRSGEL